MAQVKFIWEMSYKFYLDDIVKYNFFFFMFSNILTMAIYIALHIYLYNFCKIYFKRVLTRLKIGKIVKVNLCGPSKFKWPNGLIFLLHRPYWPAYVKNKYR